MSHLVNLSGVGEADKNFLKENGFSFGLSFFFLTLSPSDERENKTKMK